uniref:Diphthine--ammonia ligase n=1 Tax=Callorhinchus milii TaxID=7868 RepID=V9KG05_CALMI
MKVVALISGGKDSCYNMMQCVAAGHEVVALANLKPVDHKDELDSYMYQTVGHQTIDLYSEAIGLPLYRHTIQGSSLAIGREYTKCEGDEVEDLYYLLKQVKEKEGVEGVSVGAILSDYQRVRVEHVCRRLNLQSLAYLWRRNQEDLLREIILSNVQAMIIKVAAFGLDPEKHLGKTLEQLEPYLIQISQKYGVHVCGEGGEYETFTLDCPLFKKRIVVDSSEVVIHSADAFAPVGYLRFLSVHLENKPNQVTVGILHSKMGSCSFCCDMENNIETELSGEHSNLQVMWNPTSHSPSETEELNYWSGKTKSGYQWINGIHGAFSPADGKNIDNVTNEAFFLLQAQLETKGYMLTDIVLVHLYVQSMSDFAAINVVYQSYFNLNPPARVCVEASLPDGVLLQLDCLVHKNELTTHEPFKEQKEVMHVQSISHWAPANIGPYSQSVKIANVIFCAGQIGLVPCTMQLVKGVRSQAIVSLNHIQKVLEAMKSGTNLSNIILANCYVTDKKYVSVVQNIWQKTIKENIKEENMYGQSKAVFGPLIVAVVSHLPKDAAVEWHVVALTDDPCKRKSLSMNQTLDDCKIDCEVVESSFLSSAAISLTLSLLLPSVTSLHLNIVMKELATMLQQALDKLPQDIIQTPLCFRTFYRKDAIDANSMQIEFRRCLEELMGSKFPPLILVPVADLPGLEILHIACWLSI